MSAIRGYLKRFRPGQQTRLVADPTNLNRIADILEDIYGIGCHVEKPTDGSPWCIVVDALAGGGGLPGGFPCEEWVTFGITSDVPYQLKVWNGRIRIPMEPPTPSIPVDAADTTITFADGDGQYIGWKWTPGSAGGTLEIVGPQQNEFADFTDSNGTYHQQRSLYKLNVRDGLFTMVRDIVHGEIPDPVYAQP